MHVHIYVCVCVCVVMIIHSFEKSGRGGRRVDDYDDDEERGEEAAGNDEAAEEGEAAPFSESIRPCGEDPFAPHFHVNCRESPFYNHGRDKRNNRFPIENCSEKKVSHSNIDLYNFKFIYTSYLIKSS